MLPVRTSARPTVGQLARAQTFRFLTMLATWALIFAAFVYEPAPSDGTETNLGDWLFGPSPQVS
jgi:hypothetical protein